MGRVYEISRTATTVMGLMTWEGTPPEVEIPTEALDLLDDEDRAHYDAGTLHWVIGEGPLLPVPPEEFEDMKEQLRQYLMLTGLA